MSYFIWHLKYITLKSIYYSSPIKTDRKVSPIHFDKLYSLEGICGKGSFGRVYKAKNNIDSTNYAVRIIDQNNHCNTLSDMFAKEDAILNIGHENVMQMFHFALLKDDSGGKKLN